MGTSGAAPAAIGKYELLGELGRGAMGTVYRAWDASLQREVALKTMSVSFAGMEDDDRARFSREARSVARLSHANIVTVHDFGEEGGIPYIAMELLQGQSLLEALKAEPPLPLWRRIEIAARVCDGLDRAHQAGVVHRDIKPANVFIQADGTVKILDFGIAKLLSGATAEATRTGLIIGTVDYMSPEQVRGDRDLDGRSDLFSVGVMLHEMVLGRKAFEADSVGAILYRIVSEPPDGAADFDATLPPALASLLHGVLAKSRHARPVSAAIMSAQLDRIASDLKARGDRLITSPRPAPAPARRDDSSARSGLGRLWLALGALAVATAVVLLWPGAGNEQTGPPAGREESARQAEPPPGALFTGASRRRASADAPAAVIAQVDPSLRPIAPAGDSDAAGSAEAAGAPVSVAPALAAPPASTDAFLVVTATPWARLARAENLDTGEMREPGHSTPVRLALPPGRWRLTLTHPDSHEPLVVEASVRPGETAVVSGTIPGFSPARFLATIMKGGGLVADSEGQR